MFNDGSFYNTSQFNDPSSLVPIPYMPGSLRNDTVWSGTIYINGSNSVVVPQGKILTILPGTTVIISSLRGIYVQGTLVARGTSSARITFRGNELLFLLSYWL